MGVPLAALPAIKLPTSMFRWVTTPSNGAITCWKSFCWLVYFSWAWVAAALYWAACAACFILVLGLLSLRQTVLELRDLIVDLGCGELRKELPRLYPIADIDVALQHIAGGPRIYVRLLEGQRRSWQ